MARIGRPPNGVKEFWAKVDRREENDCWPWKAGKDYDGYGIFSVGDKSCRATRYLATVVMGLEAADLEVCHSCDNPPCCNPAHIFLGTRAENKADSVKKKRHAFGERIDRAKLTVNDIHVIRDLLKKKVSRSKIAARFGVQKAAINSIAWGKTWKHVPEGAS